MKLKIRLEKRINQEKTGTEKIRPKTAGLIAGCWVITLILLFRTSEVASLSRFRVKFEALANRLYASNEEATQRGHR
jgi:hypothetical protein